MSTEVEKVAPAVVLPAALAPDLAQIVAAAVSNPDFDVAKLTALFDLNERVQNRAAKAAFDDAFSRMWPELPEIDEKGAIRNKDGTIKSRYAKYEDIQSAIRPVLKQYGFALRHRVEFPRDNIVRVVGILSGHGHTEESAFEAPPDANDYRTKIQDQGSTLSYGYRYTTFALLNIITRGVDNDGQEKPKEPAGFEDWWLNMQTVAGDGMKSLEKAFSASPKHLKEWATNQKRTEWAELKRKAGAVGSDTWRETGKAAAVKS